MAFLITCKLMAYEFRGMTMGTSQKGTVYKTLRLESPDGVTAEVSCSDSALFPAVDALKKGDICNWECRAVGSAGKDHNRSYIVLISAPQHVGGVPDDVVGY